MRKLLMAVAALSVLGGGAALAQPHDDHRGPAPQARDDHRGPPARVVKHAPPAHNWARGQHLPKQYWGGGYTVSDWKARHLRQPPRGYHWVQVDNNYVLAALATGLISDIVANH